MNGGEHAAEYEGEARMTADPAVGGETTQVASRKPDGALKIVFVNSS